MFFQEYLILILKIDKSTLLQFSMRKGLIKANKAVIQNNWAVSVFGISISSLIHVSYNFFSFFFFLSRRISSRSSSSRSVSFYFGAIFFYYSSVFSTALKDPFFAFKAPRAPLWPPLVGRTKILNFRCYLKIPLKDGC